MLDLEVSESYAAPLMLQQGAVEGIIAVDTILEGPCNLAAMTILGPSAPSGRQRESRDTAARPRRKVANLSCVRSGFIHVALPDSMDFPYTAASSDLMSVDPANLVTGTFTKMDVPAPEDSIFISPRNCRKRSRIPLIPTPKPWV